MDITSNDVARTFEVLCAPQAAKCMNYLSTSVSGAEVVNDE